MDILKLALSPFSWLYSIVVYLRNKAFDLGWFGSKRFSVSTLVVGNLSFGGTGKTPMILWLIKEVFNANNTVVLSRGYGRKSVGFKWVKRESIPEEVGDEPLQIFNAFDQLPVAVCEDRSHGIERIVNEYSPEVILLDDAFQHRKVSAKANILLTTYLNPFYNDCYFPKGRLRDHKTQANRADIIVVTKCPEDLTKKEAERIKNRVSKWSSASVFFASLKYPALNDETFTSLRSAKNLLITGIADASPLESYLLDLGISFDHLRFKDHHAYQASDFSNLNSYDQILTTAKDKVKLEAVIPNQFIQVIEVEHSICFDQKDELIHLVLRKTFDEIN
jgi:tetraacyldisaccharide 4'-kinase